jgi:hypothetical protein
MKPQTGNHMPQPCAPGGSQGAHTLTELIVSMSVFSLTIIGIIACHLAGLRFNWFIQPKIENAEYARETLTRVMEEVRSATSVQVGSGSSSTFVPAGATNVQSGNAMRIFPSTSTNQFIYYFFDSGSQDLNRVQLQGSSFVTIASGVTNAVFDMEDFSGTVLTNSQNNAVLGILLQLQRDLPVKGMFDAYQISAKITRRNIL